MSTSNETSCHHHGGHGSDQHGHQHHHHQGGHHGQTDTQQHHHQGGHHASQAHGAHEHASDDVAEANRHHWNHVNDYANIPKVWYDRGKRAASAISKAVVLDKESTSVLEFACGYGLVARELIPRVGSFVGVDISEVPVKLFNEDMEKQGLAHKAKAVAVDLSKDPSALGGAKFDLVYCPSAYHHFADPGEITRLLATLVKPRSGALVVIDHLLTGNTEKEKVPEEVRHMVPRFGFNEDEMRALFEQAGMVLELFERVESQEGDNELFIAKGALVV